MSMKGHVWISLGMCADGSESEAVQLARQIMGKHYPDWYSKYPRCDRPYSYLEKSSAMRWSILSDEEGIREMSAEKVVEVIFGMVR